jgi:hypothetical protein
VQAVVQERAGKLAKLARAVRRSAPAGAFGKSPAHVRLEAPWAEGTPCPDVRGIRSPTAHKPFQLLDDEEAFEELGLAGMLMRPIDEASLASKHQSARELATPKSNPRQVGATHPQGREGVEVGGYQ